MVTMKKNIVLALMVVVGFPLVLVGWANARPSMQEVLGEIEITDKEECAIVKVSFNLMVRYKRHFPYKSGEELRIQIEPIAFTESEKEAVGQDESITPPESDIAGIDQVFYEGGDSGQQSLTLFFNHPVSYTVQQGADSRSIVVHVFLPSATLPCEP